MQGRPEGLRTTQQTSSRTLGGMFSATMKKQSKEQSSTPQSTTPDTAPTVEASNTKQVTTELLIQAWTAFAMQLPENERALSDRMKIITPTLHPDNEFSIAVDNQLVADMFEKESKRIIDGIAHEIGGARLRMKIIVNKVVVERHVYDRTKQYEILKNKNPLVEKLREQLNLELS